MRQSYLAMVTNSESGPPRKGIVVCLVIHAMLHILSLGSPVAQQGLRTLQVRAKLLLYPSNVNGAISVCMIVDLKK